jgi:hypothetical protein
MDLLLHEYAFVLYGVLAWQLQQHFTHKTTIRQRLNFIGRSMIWGGMLVVFDDELADWLLESFEIDLYFYDENHNAIGIDWYFYTAIGFLIDIIRQKITNHKEAKS